MNGIEIKRTSVAIAQEINTIKEQTNKILLQSSIEIGKRLLEAKEIVGHGNWTKWLEEEVDYSQRTAQNLMKIYEEYGPQMLKNPNSQSIANLGYTQAVAMLKLDFEERENFVLENNVDEMTIKQLEEAIKEKAEILKQKEDIQLQLEMYTNKEAESEKAKIEAEQKIKQFEEEIRIKNEEAEQLKVLIRENTQVNDFKEYDPAQVQQLQDDVELKKAEIDKLAAETKELKRKLKEKQAEKPEVVEVEKIVEVVPEGLKKELEELKDKLATTNLKLNASDNVAKFKSTFGVLVNLFNDMINTLDQIKEEDIEQYSKYKEAVNKLLERLMINE
jgi:hypothetical protein